MFREIGRAVRDARTRRDYYDYNLLAVIILLVAFGLIILYSASSYDAATNSKMANDSMWYLRHQAPISVGAVLICVWISRFDYHYLKNWAGLLYVVSIILMAMVRFTPLGVSANGSRRWLKIGVQFQPSEIAKIAVIVFIPYLIILMGRKVNTLKGTMTLIFVGALPAVAAWQFTDNLSTGLIIGMITMVIIFVSHPKTAPFMVLLLIIGVMAFGVVYYASTLDSSVTESFRLRRIQVWLHPEEYSDYGGYQVIQGLYAIGSGGLMGAGIGNSRQKYLFLPEPQNDYVFSVVCEELGFVGALVVIVLFALLIWRGFTIVIKARDRFGAMLVTGFIAQVGVQAILNMAVVTNTIPSTGISLPFFSYGGTALAILLGEMGIVLSVSRQTTVEKE